ncbi:abnormal chemosensory protein 6 isoform X1 [Temnothorax americanus]|uniref:abnormal chemosensory protein 6 isoform X1 n=1 Tax=Temnothorax americanus TaxID=1964332 RepID=UPI00406911C3
MMYSPDKMMGSKGLHGAPITAPGCFPSGRYSPPPYRAAPDPMPPPPRRCMPNSTSRIFEDASIVCNSWSPRHNGDLFSGLNSGLQDGLLSRAEALAADLGKHNAGTPMPLKHDPVSVYHHGAHMPTPHPNNRPHHQVQSHLLMSHPGMESLDMLDPANSMTTLTPMSDSTGSGPGHHAGIHGPSVYGGMNGMMSHHHHHSNLGSGGGSVPHPAHHHPAMAAAAAAAAAAGLHPDADTDPRELEAFAERFKQRRIKLGVTQADVGKALANLKLPGVGALSQSTICRFESLTLSHNNMIALKPILQAWLEEAEAQAKNKRRDPDAPSVLPASEKKRKRTSIAAPEKRSLEAYFAVQPRPSGEKIAAIAEKLDLKKNVVRVWFCNQRQKQKRMKFAAQH